MPTSLANMYHKIRGNVDSLSIVFTETIVPSKSPKMTQCAFSDMTFCRCAKSYNVKTCVEA